jgi:hypothetical protein
MKNMTYPQQLKSQNIISVINSVIVFVLTSVLSFVLIPLSPFTDATDKVDIALMSAIIGLVTANGFLMSRLILRKTL